MCDYVSLLVFGLVPVVLYVINVDKKGELLELMQNEKQGIPKEQIPLAIAKGLVMFSSGLKETILQPLLINFYGSNQNYVSNILSLEIFTFTMASVFIGIIPESRRNYTCMSILACVMCCVGLMILGLDIEHIEIKREQAIWYLSAGVAICGIA